jgi:hypothetical protein
MFVMVTTQQCHRRQLAMVELARITGAVVVAEESY